MPVYQIPQFVDGIIGPVNIFLEATKDLFGFIVEKVDQNIIFIFEIKIDCPIGNPGFFCDLRNRRLKETLLGKILYGGFKNAMVFIVIFFFSSNNRPPSNSYNCFMNECSFILSGKFAPVKKKSVGARFFDSKNKTD